MELINNAWDFIVKTLLEEVIIVVTGVLFAQFIQNRWVKWRYGGWRVIVQRKGEDILNREISAGKVKDILAEPADLSVFLKGVASPYAWINCDLIKDGRDLGLLIEDREKRYFLLNLDKNPVKEKESGSG